MTPLNYQMVIVPHDDLNFTYITDLHLSHVPIGRRRDNYRQAIFDKINFVRDLTEKINGIGLCGADVFHYKKPDHPSNCISLLAEAWSVFSGFPTGRIYGSVGNHDLFFDRMDSLPTQPLGILMATGVYHNLVETPVLFVNKSQTFGVLVEAFPYENDGAKVLPRIMDPAPRPPLAKYRIGIVHQYGEPGNRGSLYGTAKIGYNEVADSDYDFLLWGHDHSRKETVTVGNTTHVNLGSLARAALPTDEDDHPVVCTVLRFKEEGAYRPKEVLIPVKPLQVAFTTADKGMDKVAKSLEVSEFFDSMEEAVNGIQSVEPREVVIKLGEGDLETTNLALEYSGL